MLDLGARIGGYGEFVGVISRGRQKAVRATTLPGKQTPNRVKLAKYGKYEVEEFRGAPDTLARRENQANKNGSVSILDQIQLEELTLAGRSEDDISGERLELPQRSQLLTVDPDQSTNLTLRPGS